jgi:UDP-N-acetylmuramoyl-L-alanyl-D-glutamate--2,6-diaminopimelate ligase
MARIEVEGVHPGTCPEVIVDYAHTPDAIAVVLAAVREIIDAAARVCLVIGAGGDRDQGKRRPMGRAAARADVVVLTDDNPRGEDPIDIVRELAAGVDEAIGVDGRRPLVHVEHDRARAIAWAVTTMAPGDVVVIAGKGHETGQEVAGMVTPFDDRTVAARVVASVGAS